MTELLHMVIRMLVASLLVPFLLASAPSIAAQTPETPDRPCAPAESPEDEFASRGLGLTPEELETLYGEPEIGQGSLIFVYQGVNLHKVECDLILTFPDGWQAGQMDEFMLAESLLPDDAEFLGNFSRGTPIGYENSTSLWWSDALAARFEAMGAGHGGTILILYTYESAGLDQGPIQRVELRTLALPE
jgi:hypothetical protein